MTNAKQFILVAISDNDTRKILIDAFQEHGCPFDYEFVSSVDGALKKLSQKSVHAIIMTKSVALMGDNGTNGLIASQIELPPTITILQKEDGYPGYLYLPDKVNDWVTMPFDLEEFYTRVAGTIRRADK